MAVFEARQFLLNPGILEEAVLSQNEAPTSDGGGKINSFRISDLLQKRKKEAVNPPSRSSSVMEESIRECSPAEHNTTFARKVRKSRTIFSNKQIKELEKTFEEHKYLSVHDRKELANRMGLSDTQVKTWYQNRRTKWKRETSSDVMTDSFPSFFQPLWSSPPLPLPLLALLRSPLFPPQISHF